MMNPVIQVTGDVKYTIHLDPTIWIFDERRFPLEERLDGVSGLAVELAPFLANAEPSEKATKLICRRRQGEDVVISMEEAKKAYLCFAKDNKPIREGGPALLYLADGSNKDQPVDYLTHLEVVE